MKRFWLGVAVLTFLLGIGIGTTVFTRRTQADISQTLELASKAALRGNWQDANRYSRKAKTDWESARNITASIADHEPMEQIDDLFAQMEIYLVTRQQIPLAACCSSLCILTDAIGETQAVNWWSLL